MASEATGSRREPSLRPARWPGRPRPGTLLRAALVAALLVLAAGLTYTQEPETCAGGTRSGSASSGGATPADGPAAGGPGSSVGPDSSADPADPAGLAGPAGPSPGAGADAPTPMPIPRGLVGVAVRLAEPAAADAVRPGGRVDLLAVPSAAARTTVAQPAVLASAALVLDVLTGGGDAPAALVLALGPAQARRVVGQPETTRFAVVLR